MKIHKSIHKTPSYFITPLAPGWRKMLLITGIVPWKTTWVFVFWFYRVFMSVVNIISIMINIIILIVVTFVTFCDIIF